MSEVQWVNGRRPTALVTGGLGGIGAAVVERLRADGCMVVTADIGEAADVVVDVTSTASVAEAVAAAGPIDILVNSAGIVGPNGPFQVVQTTAWEQTLAVNLSGTFFMCRAFIPQMVERGWGRVVNMASVAGKDGNPGLAAYWASKAGAIGVDQIARQRTGEDRRARQRRCPGRDRDTHERDHLGRSARPALQPDPDGPARAGRRGGSAHRLADVTSLQFLHGCRLRHQRRPSDVLGPARQVRWPGEPRPDAGLGRSARDGDQ